MHTPMITLCILHYLKLGNSPARAVKDTANALFNKTDCAPSVLILKRTIKLKCTKSEHCSCVCTWVFYSDIFVSERDMKKKKKKPPLS